LGHEDVSLVTPCGSPRVSDDISIGSVSDGGHGVVDESTSREAGWVIVDTSLVGLEGSAVGLDVDNDWSFLNGLLKSISASCLNVGVALGLEGWGDLFASTITSSVSVRGLSSNTVALGVLVGVL